MDSPALKKDIKFLPENTYNLISSSDIYTVTRIKQKILLQNPFHKERKLVFGPESVERHKTVERQEKANNIPLSWRRERRVA